MKWKSMSFFWVVMFLMFIAGTATSGPVPDTGQTKCYDAAGTEITCPTEGQPFYGQDGNYVKERSYTVLSGGQVVQDNVTGLDEGLHNNFVTG